MNKICLCFALVACMAATACRSHQSVQAANVNPQSRSLDMQGFSAISLQGVADVSFTQWDSYGVTVENYYEDRDEIYVSGNTLVITQKQSYRNRKNRKETRWNLKVRVSAPDLRLLTGSGVGSFDIGHVKTENFTFQLSGVVKCTFHNLEAQKIRGNASGVVTLNGMLVADKDINLSYSGVVKGALTTESQKLDYSNTGTGSHNLSFKGQTFVLTNSGTGAHHYNVEATDAKVRNSGTGQQHYDVRAQSLRINNSGTGSHYYSLDCKELSIDNSGVGTMRLEGTADKTTFEGKGVSRIDTRNLNKF